MICVIVWNEFLYEKEDDVVLVIYLNGIYG